MSIDISRALRKLRRVAERSDSLPWLEIGELVRDSVKENFRVGGRYSPLEEKMGGSNRWIERKKSASWPVLRKSDTLMENHYVELVQNGVAVGNRLIYAAVHNYGYPDKNIEKRPYLVVQPEDLVKIDNIISNYIGG